MHTKSKPIKWLIRVIFISILLLLLDTVKFQNIGVEPVSAVNTCTNLANWQCVETRPGLSLCRANNTCVVKVDLNNNSIRPKVVIAPNGGTDWLSSIGSSANAYAAINGDYFSGCPDTNSPLNCGEGLTYINGTDYTDYTGTEWQNRRSLGFNDGYDPNIGWPNEQGGYHRQLLGGGPQVSFGGEYRWRCWYQGNNTEGNCSCQNNTVVINDELFGCSANNWWGRPQTFIGFSDDRNTLYLAVSEPGYNKTPREMHDVLWVQGARYTIKMDGGGSSGMYYNDGGYQFSWNGGRAVANAWVIVPNNDPPPPQCNPNSDQVALYVDANYSGSCVVKSIGNYPNPGSIGIANDSVTSIKVGGNVKLTICRDDNYVGTCETFQGDDSNLGDNGIGDNQVSSAKVESRGGSCSNGATYAPLQSGYNSCANEGGTCTFSGQASVAYGANNCFFYQTFTGSVACNNNIFGDPIVGTGKACYSKILTSPPSANFDAWPESGIAPFTTELHIVNMSNITSCSWNYGDGQTSTSCSQLHNHTYSSPGSYTVQLTVSGPSGSDSMTRTNYINVSEPPPAACPTITNWKGEYWTNSTLFGSPALCRDDFEINFDWGLGSPDPAISNDNYSARWTRTTNFDNGTYSFHIQHDDGARLYIDDTLKGDFWGTCCEWDVVDVPMSAGSHTVRMEMFENGGAAHARLWWENLSNTATFGDVPLDHPLYKYIQALYDGGYTGGCSTDPLMFCPDTILDRAQSAVFMLRGQLGSGYTPPPAPWYTFLADNWTGFEYAQAWAEGMWQEGLTAGCQASPLMYCPATQLPRVEASVFGLKMKYGVNYLPPPATGTLFADLTDTSFWGTGWAEQAYLDGLLPECGFQAGKPLYCPNDLVNRAWGAYLIVQAKGLLPAP